MKTDLQQRSNFSVMHLMSAARFSRLCYKVEEENKGKSYGPFIEEVNAYTTSAVLLSVASIEANINETFADALDNFVSIGNFDQNFIKIIWQTIEKEPILDKYQFVLNMKGKGDLDKSTATYQSIQTLIKVRNALVHYKPEWHDNQVEHDKIGKILRGKFKLSPFLDELSPIFPMRCMTHGFTQWAVQSSLRFFDWYSSLADLPNRYTDFSDRLKTK